MDVTACDADGNYPLHWLGRGVSLMFAFKGVSVQLKNDVKTSTEAQNKGFQVSRAGLLFDQGAVACINACNKFSQTPLHVALASGLSSLAMLLLQKGANPNILDVHLNLPLHLACTGWCRDILPVLQLLLARGSGQRVVPGAFDANDVALGLNHEQRETERVERILTTNYQKNVTAPPAVLSKQISKQELLMYPNQKGEGPFHVACGSCANSEHFGPRKSGSNTGYGPLGAHSLPLTSGAATTTPTNPTGTTNSTSAGTSTDTTGTAAAAEEHKMERLLILEHLLHLNTMHNASTNASSGKFPVVDPNARSTLQGLTGLHYLARASSTLGDPHLDEQMVDMVVQAGGDVNAVDAQTRAGGGGPRYAPLHYALKKSPELAWHLLRVDGAVAHPPTANPPALLIACEEGVAADMIGYLVTHGENANITGNLLFLTFSGNRMCYQLCMVDCIEILTCFFFI